MTGSPPHSSEASKGSPLSLDELAQGFEGAQILLTAHRLGVFTALAAGERSSDEVAAAIGADRRGTRILCDALAALGLLGKGDDDRYANGAEVRAHLLPDSPRPLGAMLRHRALLYARWGRLADAVVTGTPVPEDAVDPRLLGDEESFAGAMADLGRASAAAVADALDLAGVGALLDVGGGPGIYACEFARREPGLRAVVLDRPGTVEVAREQIRRAGLAGRVEARAGDAFTADWGGPYDLVFTSNFLHVWGPEENRRLIARAAAVLAPGGRLVVKDLFLDPGRTAPAGAALFAVSMLVSTERGDAYTVEEVQEWMAAAGLTPAEVLPVATRSRLVVGRKDG